MQDSEKGLEQLILLRESLVTQDLSSASESDTRAKVITAILTRVLGWQESDIIREEHTDSGFMDYVLSTHRRALVVEAKKSGDTFSVPADTKMPRTFKVGGVLRTVANLRSHIDQVSLYCATAGIEYAVISNGHQWLVFRGSRIDGRSVHDGILVLFASLNDIEARFIDFWNLLSRPAVFSDSLQRALNPSMVSKQFRRIVDELHDRGDKVSRNSLSIALTPLIQEYLQEITADGSERLRDLYVRSRRLEDAMQALEYRLSLALSQTVARNNVSSEGGSIDAIKASVEQRVTGALRRKRGETILLLGRVGSGKTTFVSHFLRVDLKAVLASHLSIHIDYRTLEPGKDLRQFFYDNLRRALAANEDFAKLAGENVRRVYAPEIRELSIGPLAVLERTNKGKYEEKIAEFLEQQYTHKSDQYYTRTLKYAADKLGIRCLIIFDNVDQLTVDLQQHIFAFAHSISAEALAICLLTMWEETFVRSKRHGVMAAYPTSGYALPQISVVDVLRRRLEFLVKDLRKGGSATDLISDEGLIEDTACFLELVSKSLLHDRLRARYFLESVAMGNLRRAMDLFSTFLTSGHTDSGKMLSIVRRRSAYLIPLHEFIKSIGLQDNKTFQSDLSPLLNLYTIADESRPSHLTKSRILEYLFFHRNKTTATFGMGFVRYTTLRIDLERIGTSDLDVLESIKALTTYSLIENDIYDIDAISAAYRITPAGRYYIRFLASRFSYLDLVFQDTPISDNAVFESIKSLYSSREMLDRFQRVRLFLGYLDKEEESEYSVVASKSESIPLRRRFLPDYRVSLEKDIEFINRQANKTKYRGDRTPYREA